MRDDTLAHASGGVHPTRSPRVHTAEYLGSDVRTTHNKRYTRLEHWLSTEDQRRLEPRISCRVAVAVVVVVVVVAGRYKSAAVYNNARAARTNEA